MYVTARTLRITSMISGVYVFASVCLWIPGRSFVAFPQDQESGPWSVAGFATRPDVDSPHVSANSIKRRVTSLTISVSQSRVEDKRQNEIQFVEAAK